MSRRLVFDAGVSFRIERVPVTPAAKQEIAAPEPEHEAGHAMVWIDL